jgi:hypothetical protein
VQLTWRDRPTAAQTESLVSKTVVPMVVPMVVPTAERTVERAMLKVRPMAAPKA